MTGAESGGAYFAMDAIAPPGGGPPPHIHRNEDETFYVMEGEVEFLLGDVLASAGDFVNVPRGTVHHRAQRRPALRRPARPVGRRVVEAMVSPESRLLRYFVVVAQELSFTRAAERIGIAQPALSAAIRQLEAQLEVQLLARTTRSVALTDAGRALLDRAPAALGGLQEAWEAARVAGRGELGTLRLVYGASTSYGTTPRLVEAVRERLPGLEVVTEMRATPHVVAAVRDGAADVGVARAPAAGDGVRVRTVRVERRGVLVRAGDPLAERAEVPLAQAATRPILMHPRATNPSHYDALLAVLAAAGVDSPQLVERPVAFDPGGRLIREGRAIAIVGVSSAEGLAPDLRWVPLAEPVPRIEVGLLVREGPPSPATERFERIAVATAARLGWLADTVPAAGPSD